MSEGTATEGCNPHRATQGRGADIRDEPHICEECGAFWFQRVFLNTKLKRYTYKYCSWCGWRRWMNTLGGNRIIH